MRKAIFARAALAAALVLLFGAAEPGAQEASARGGEPPRPDFLTSDPGFAELGALPDPLSPRELGKAALLASGVAVEGIPAYESRLEALYGELRAGAGDIAEPAARGEAILGLLHKRVFKAYSENATTLDGVLDGGLYNCVSSAVLYALAARSLGLEVEGARTSTHAFCVLVAGERRIDVETTNPYGFDPGDKKEFKDSFGRATGFAYVAPGSYGDRVAIDARALVGLILSNRASMLELKGRFPEATRLGADYDELCRDAESRSFLAMRINNLVAELETRRDYLRAESVAMEASAFFPEDDALAVLYMNAGYNRTVALSNSGDWGGAFDLALSMAALFEGKTAVPRGGRSAPGPKDWADIASNALASLAQSYAARGDFELARRAVAERADRAGPAATAKAYSIVGEEELVRAANKLPFAEGEKAADRVYSAGEVGLARYSQAMAAIYGNEAGRIGQAGDWLGGAALAERGAAKLAAAKAPGDGGLAQLARDLRRNFAIEAHNRFAKLYNAGDYGGAAAAIKTALASLPGDPSLERDLKAALAAAEAGKDPKGARAP